MNKALALFATGYVDPWVFERGCGWGAGPAAYVKRLLLIAEDHGYTFKTCDQGYAPACALPYGP